MASKKIDKQYVLSDNSVNCYGFRLLTSGYMLSEFLQNPIGYYMHLRDDGVVVRWEDLRIVGENIVGRPVINLANKRGEQTANEVESGFLNAASMGDIVVLEYSNEPSMLLPGQTGPTITKWYNKECSLVDIPGNKNALTNLFDRNNNPINLSRLTGKVAPITTRKLSSEREAEVFPQELFCTKEQLMSGLAAKLKDSDYTLYAVLLDWFYYGANHRNDSRVNPVRYDKYTAELVRRRVDELMKMTPDELFNQGLFEELKKLDERAFKKKWAEIKK